MYYRFEITAHIRHCPALFTPLVRLNNKLRGFNWPAYITRDTEFVLEGYFRSGNTFAYRAFTLAQSKPVNMANHTHAPATLVEAVRYKIPTLVLLREPADTVVSATLKHPGTTLEQHLRWYIKYYEIVHELRESLYIALFQEVKADFGQVIKSVNQRFNTAFEAFNHTPQNVREVFDWIETMDRGIYANDISRYSLPLQDRKRFKDDLFAELKAKKYSNLLEQAGELYDAIAIERGKS